MAEPFLSEIRITSFNFPPKGWAFCNGQLLPINMNMALFSLLGTTFGGDGRTEFALPDLRGRIPIHMGAGHTLGERGGETAHTLSQSEMPTHTPSLQRIIGCGEHLGAHRHPGHTTECRLRGPGALVALAAASSAAVGGSQAHNNLQPFLVLNFIIALQGIFPSPN
jgi:microcystin-dependent protein